MNATIPARDYSILIADDDRGCRDALRAIMEPEGYRTVLASSGEEALDIFGGGDVHLVLVDMYMPTLNGLETLRLAREMNVVVPAILLTGDLNDALLRQACAAEVFSVIPKPVSKNVVLYTVVRALRRFYGRR
jgi:CheY-like chemotaxis protein